MVGNVLHWIPKTDLASHKCAQALGSSMDPRERSFWIYFKRC